MPKNRSLVHRLIVLVSPISAVLIALMVNPSSATRSSSADAATLVTPALTAADHVEGVPLVERVVSGDMVVDWHQEPPADARRSGDDGEHDHAHDLEGARTDAEEEPEPHDPAGETTYAANGASGGGGVPGQGFTPISTSIRWRSTGYTIRLAGPDGRVEELRDEFAAVAQAASSAAGAPVVLSPSRGGAATPAAGEITVVVGPGPCGRDVAGCGGPAVRSTEIVSGRVWISPESLRYSSANRSQLAFHELGHALGLDHHAHDWSDGRQAMYPRLAGIASFRDGDRRGLRYLSGRDDQPAGQITTAEYAAGGLTVKGSVSSGSRVRITLGSTATDVNGSGGAFVATLAAPAGTHRVCATSLDAGPGFRRDLGCVTTSAPGSPFGRVDLVAGSFETVRVAGWAVDPQTAAAVDVQVRRNGELVWQSPADRPRTDVAAKHPAYGSRHGFDVNVPAVAGRNDVCVRVRGVGAGGDTDLGCRRVDHAVDPVGAFRAERTPLGVTVSGWALDPNTAAAVEIRATVGGSLPATPGRFRADRRWSGMPDAYPNHTGQHGFSQQLVLAPGEHRLCLSVTNVGLGQDRSLGCVHVSIDLPVAAGGGTTAGSTLPGAAQPTVATILRAAGTGG